MATPLTANDLWPVLLKLPHDERVRLATLALKAASLREGEEPSGYASVPPGADEFGADGDPLAWDAEGWDDVDAAR